MAWLLAAGGIAAIGGIVAANWDWFKNIPRPDLAYLSAIKLKALDGSGKEIMASDLWRNSGAVIMEALELSSLKPELDKRGINLVGIVHEEKGVKKFQPYLNSPIYLDEERNFYGPEQRWMLISGFFRIGVWRAGLRALRKDIVWDLKGEGRILGGVFVVGPGEQGILLDHVAKDFGDEVDPKDVMTAVEKIKYYSTEKSQL